MTEKTKIVRTSDKIETGKFEINKEVGLSKVLSLTITKAPNSKIGTVKADGIYKVSVVAKHPIYGKEDFTFLYNPRKLSSHEFHNAKGDRICMGTCPSGEIKDIVISALSHESYAFQLSMKVTAWVHAERNPNNSQYLLWHYKYYRKYSPRLKWELPERCIKNELWKKNKCNICAGNKCEYLLFKCDKCGTRTKNLCNVCNSPICTNHSKCINGHYVLTKTGMFEGICSGCGEKVYIGNKKCNNCGQTTFRDF